MIDRRDPSGAQAQSDYYSMTRRIPLAIRLSLRVRRQMFERFMEEMRPTPDCTVLDLGVTSEQGVPDANYFEQWYPWPERIVCAGVEDASHLERRHKGVTFRRVAPHEPLPFRNRQFDILFSNAVVEHAGSRAQQRFFVNECLRVAGRFFITTPNRWFPIEMHTALPLLHYLPARLHRHLLSAIGLGSWASEAQLNVLDGRSFRSLFPPDQDVRILRIKLGGIGSNLIACGKRVPWATCQFLEWL
jgi:SAM-dependent methyltransferase